MMAIAAFLALFVSAVALAFFGGLALARWLEYMEGGPDD